jgi:hypothetical protein
MHGKLFGAFPLFAAIWMKMEMVKEMKMEMVREMKMEMVREMKMV